MREQQFLSMLNMAARSAPMPQTEMSAMPMRCSLSDAACRDAMIRASSFSHFAAHAFRRNTRLTMANVHAMRL